MASGVKVVGGSGAAPGKRRAAVSEPGAGAAEPADPSGAEAAQPGDATVAEAEVVGGEPDDGNAVVAEVDEAEIVGRRPKPAKASPRRSPERRRRAGVVALAALAVLGIAGTVGFGLAWDGLQGTQSGETAARSAARSFLVDLTNFNAKTVDADFSAVSSMATGAFATQAQKFFNSAIRQDLQKALASSRGQIRALYVQSYGGGQAAVYAVVDQLYVNDKLTSPQTDVLRIVVDMSQVGGAWKVADVTVLQGPSLGSTTSSGSSGSTTTTSGSGSTTPTTTSGSGSTTPTTAAGSGG